MSTHQQAITSLAILKVQWDRGHDYIDNFVPFIAECLRSHPADKISLPTLQASIASSFGLNIPLGALRSIAGRAVRRGYARFEGRVLIRNPKALSTSDFTVVSASALRKHNALIAKLQEFVSSRFKAIWAPQEAEAALLGFLTHRSIPVLQAAIEGAPIVVEVKHSQDAYFMISAFVAALSEADPDGFEFLETVVKGNMLADALYFPELGRIAQRFDHVEVYLDTSFLLRALGFSSIPEKVANVELLQLLYQTNASLRCFQHTVEEMRGILDAAALALQNPSRLRTSFGEAIEFFIRNGRSTSDVELAIARLPASLAQLRVQVKPTPPFEESLSVDEVQFEVTLRDRVGYHKDETLRRDLDSITAVHRLRGGHLPQDVERCIAIFVTDNLSLVRASAHFFREQYGETAAVVPHCVSDHVLATLAWLKSPLQLPDLPRRKILADCYAALNPPNSLWRKYLEEIGRLEAEGLVTEGDFTLLRFSSEARVLLMDTTRGDDDRVSRSTIMEVLQQSRNVIVAPAHEALASERHQREAAESRASLALQRAQTQYEAIAHRIETASLVLGKVLSRLALVSVIVALCALAILGFTGGLGVLPSFAARVIVGLLFALSLLIYVANLTFGTTLISLAKRLEVNISNGASRVAKRALDMKDPTTLDPRADTSKDTEV